MLLAGGTARGAAGTSSALSCKDLTTLHKARAVLHLAARLSLPFLLTLLSAECCLGRLIALRWLRTAGLCGRVRAETVG